MANKTIADLTAGTPPYDAASLIEVEVPNGLGGFNSRKALVYDGKSIHIAKVSPTTLTKTSDVVLEDVPGLSVTLQAGKTYLVRGRIVGTANVSGGIQLALVAAGGLTVTSMNISTLKLNTGASTAPSANATALGVIYNITAVYTDLYFDGVIVVNAGGTLKVQAAQNASFGTPSTVLLNSYIKCERVDP